MTQIELSPFCSEQALQINQPIYGTASAETTIWFLLEYTEPWTVKAVQDNNLPTAVQDFLSTNVVAIPQSRVVFIKKSSKKPASLTFYVAISREQQQALYKWDLASYEALLEIDLAAVAAESAEFVDHLCQDNLFLVCTNGKRDQCCAKFGFPIFQAMAEAEPANTWQCTHIGGHRYAPVVGVYPAGLYYRVIDEDAGKALIANIQSQTVSLDGYRGRTCYTGASQAADYFLRQETGQQALSQFRFVSQQTEGQTHTVTFTDQANKTRHEVKLEQGLTEPLLSGCTLGKSKPQPAYQLISHTKAAL